MAFVWYNDIPRWRVIYVPIGENRRVHRLARHARPILTRLAAARVLILILFHVFAFGACFVFANLARFDFVLRPQPEHFLFRTNLPFVVSIQLLVGMVFGFYSGWWRYVGIRDVLRTVAGMSVALGILLTARFINPILTGPSRGVLLIDWAFTILTLFGARVLIRMARDRIRDERVPVEQRRVIIIGAGDAGEALAREIEHRPQIGMKVVAFVDDKTAKWQSHIRGVQVRGPISDVAFIAEKLEATEALIAIPTAPGPRIREVVGYLKAAGLACKTIPGMDQLVTGKVHVTQLRPVNLEDLLRREKIDLPGDPVRRLFNGKRVLITGAGGTIGSELASQVLGFEPEQVCLVERSEYALYLCRNRLQEEIGSLARVTSQLVGIREYDVMKRLLSDFKPNIVLHAAAHKHVPLGEENPAEYVRNNCLATRKLAEICEEHGVRRFVFISTDKAINPTSVMGATKRAAEIALLDLAKRSRMRLTIVRFGNVIGSSGSVVPLFLDQIAKGGPVTVTHPEVTRYFLRTSEAISLVLQAATLGDGGRVFMLDMGEPVKIVDLARDLIHLSNHTEDEIPIVFTGMRPGEKLYEEVRLQGEHIEPTVHPQIVITEAPQPHPALVHQWLQRLEASCSNNDAAVVTLKELIPEYTLSEQYAKAFQEHQGAIHIGGTKEAKPERHIHPALESRLTH